MNFLHQYRIFYDWRKDIQKSNFLKKYYALFNALNLTAFPDRKIKFGRKGYSRHAILRALIFKQLENIKHITELISRLDENPIPAELCGFEVGQLPDPTVFGRFLKNTKNEDIRNLHIKINQKLIDKNIISLNHFIMDSKPVKANTKDNNPKNPNRNITNKKKKPKRNKKATLSYYYYQTMPDNSKKIFYFWGFRTHVIVSKEGIPLVEITVPNNVVDADIAKKLIKRLKRIYKFKRDSFFVADAAYDFKDIYNLIVNGMKSKAFIPLNPRNQQKPKQFGTTGLPLCNAGLEMKSAGTWPEGNRYRAKFRCPIKISKKFAKKYPNGCPIKCEKFWSGKQYGCTKYLDITDDARARTPRDTDFFKGIYNTRQMVEQYFSRLGDREAEQTVHYSYKAIKNQMSIAHLTMSLVALAAVQLGKPENIRCYRYFASPT